MSQRMTMDEVLKEYGVPQLRLDVHATRSDLLKLREKLMAIRDLSDGREQGYLDVECKLYIDVDDIDRYLSGELDTVGEIYAFPEDIKSYQVTNTGGLPPYRKNIKEKSNETEKNHRSDDGRRPERRHCPPHRPHARGSRPDRTGRGRQGRRAHRTEGDAQGRTEGI